jgi:quercetin dioxygenase-like cupin family protein
MKKFIYVAAVLAASLVTAQAHDVTKPVLAYDTKDAKVTLVYEHPLPDVPGKSIKAALVEYGPGGYSAAHTNTRSPP